MEASTYDEQTKHDLIKNEPIEEYSLDAFVDDLIDRNKIKCGIAHSKFL